MWKQNATEIAARLEQAGWERPWVGSRELSTRLVFNYTAILQRVSWSPPDLPTEQEIQGYEERGRIVLALTRWLEAGGALPAPLCPPDQVAAAAQTEGRFSVLSNGMYAFGDQASLMYAWGYGLYWSKGPAPITAERAEAFRRARAGKSGVGDTDRTSIEADGYWDK